MYQCVREKVPGGAYRPAAVVALAPLNTVPRKVSNTPTGVARFASAAEAAIATTTTTTTTVSASAAAAGGRIWAVARDVPGLTTAVALRTTRAAAPATTTTATTRGGGGAVARL